MTQFAVKDSLLAAQTLRTAGSAAYGGADLGECFATAARVKGTDLDSWYDEWNATARITLKLAEKAMSDGQTETARLAFFRASNYFRNAGVMLMGTPIDPRVVESNRSQTDAFRRGAALLNQPPERIQIPYEGTQLPGYFFRVDADETPRPTVLLTGGYDGTAEELYFFNGAAALARGYNVLAFDGPGQGSALLVQGLVLRPDWENVITPVVDYLCSRVDVDATKIAIIGLSLGGQLAPRAASVEHRLAACIADCGSFDMFAAGLDRLPDRLAAGVAAGKRSSLALLGAVLRVLAGKPTAGWAIRRGLLVHGVRKPADFILALRDYTLKGRAAAITCPTLVCNAEDDDIGASAPQLFAELTCEKEFITFMNAEGAGDHCEAGARTLFHARAFGWLDGVISG